MSNLPEYAEILWKEGGVPYSEEFQDIYYAPESGYQETLHVFIEGNRITERAPQVKDSFVIAETGFGTGLNFITARSVFRRLAHAHARLIYYTCEKKPVRSEDMRRALSEALKNTAVQYDDLELPPPTPGWQLHLFDQGKTELRIFYGEVTQFLKEISSWKKSGADAWFLDGFAPSRNADMWSLESLKLIAEFTKSGGTLSTFTVAGSVRRGLEESGIICEKVPGFGNKKEMLRCYKTGFTEEQNPLPEDSEIYDAVVIGAGIAGASAAFSLVRRNRRILLLEKEPEAALHGSGNPAGVIFPFVTAEPGFISRILIIGFYYVKNIIKLIRANSSEIPGNECGVLQLFHEERQRVRLEKALISMGYHKETLRSCSKEEALSVSGLPVSTGGVFFPDSMWVSPGDLVKGLINYCEKTGPGLFAVHYNCEVKEIIPDSDTWVVITEMQDENGNRKTVRIKTRNTVVAASWESPKLIKKYTETDLPKNRGQIVLMPENEISRNQKCVICYDGYLIPSAGGVHVAGTTYEKNREDYETDTETLRSLVKEAEHWTGPLFPESDYRGRADFRSATADHLPVSGPVTDSALLKKNYNNYKKMTDKMIFQLRKEGRALDSGNELTDLIPAVKGLWLHAGHGSRGLSYAPVTSELIASQICGEIPPLPADMAAAADPRRYDSRKLRRSS